jgi:Family of unknown function (DUF6086)
MSRYFRAGGLSLWNPSNSVADLFVRTAEAVATLTEVPSGLGPMIADEHEVDPEAFAAFVDALTRQYLSSSHAILRSLLEGFLATALVLVDRSGRDLPSLRMTAVLDPRDVSVGVGGIRPLGRRERLLKLADEHAKAMPG